MTEVRVLIVDDSDAFRSALRDVVAATPGFTVVAEADSGEAAILEVERVLPDLALIDIRMPGIGGLEAAAQIVEQRPGTTVVMISADSSGEKIRHTGFLVAGKSSLRPDTLAALWRNRGSASARRAREDSNLRPAD